MNILLILWLLFPNLRDMHVTVDAERLEIQPEKVTAAFAFLDSVLAVQLRTDFSYHTGVLTGGEPYAAFLKSTRCVFPATSFLTDSTYLIIGSYTPDPLKTTAKKIRHASLYVRGIPTHFPIASLDYNPVQLTRSYMYICERGIITYVAWETIRIPDQQEELGR